MRKILSMLRIDLKLITRNPIVLFMVISPAVLSFVFLAVLGNMGQGTMNFVVDKNVPEEVIANINKIGNVEIADSKEKVMQRVEGFDSIPGVVNENGSYKIVLEGNEGTGFSEQARLLIARAISGDIPSFTSERVDSTGNIMVEVSTISLLLLALFVSSVVSGFNIIVEREGKVIRAIGVSPVNLRTFISARTLIAVLLGLANILLCAIIMGKGVYILAFVATALCSVAVTALIAIGLGCTANNLVAAIASIKLIMPACLILPVSSYFVPDRFKFLYYWLPNYWQVESIQSALSGSVNWGANLAMIVTGFSWLLLLYKLFQKKLGLR